MFWRLMSVLLIAVSMVFNVFAVTALFDAWEIADTAWKPQLYELGRLYLMVVMPIAENVTGPISNLIRMELPCWWVHILTIYAASALAIWAGSMTVDERNRRISEVKRGGMSIIWPLAIAGLIIQGFRNRVVSSFFRQNSGLAALYAVSVLGLYGAANWANINLLEGPPYPGQEMKLKNDVRCPITLPSEDEVKEFIRERALEEAKERVGAL